MCNHLKLVRVGVNKMGKTVYIIKTVPPIGDGFGHYGVLTGKEFFDLEGRRFMRNPEYVIVRKKEDAEGYAEHCMNPESRKANAWWKSRSDLAH